MRSIALIEPVGGHGGMEHYDLGLCRGLVQAGWSVAWYTCTETIVTPPTGVRLHRVYKGIWGKSGRVRRALQYLVGSIRALRQAVRDRQLICHLHFFHGAPEELVLLLLCRSFGRLVVLTVHDVESFAGASGLQTRLAQRVYRCAQALVVHNLTSRRELSTYLNVPEADITVVPHGNYLEAIGEVPSRQSAREQLGLAPDAKVILFFGQIKQVKGLDLLLEAVAELTDRPDLTLVIAGRPWKADSNQYEQKLEQLGLKSRCHLYLGYIPDAEVCRFYAAADLVVLPYRRIYQSGVLLLSMSYGRAVLVSDLPGMTEIVTDRVNGFVFRAGSVESLAASLRVAFSDDAARETVAREGLAFVSSHHSWQSCGEQLSSLYTRVLSQSGRGVSSSSPV